MTLDLLLLERRLRAFHVDDTTDPASARSAVAIVLRETAGGMHLLLIRRAERAGDPWSGHIAFPGGREAPSDANLLSTAIRETREETGIDLERDARVLGRLTDAVAYPRGKRIDLSIAPFVFVLTRETTTRASDEVAELFWTDVGPLVRGETHCTMPYPIDGTNVDFPGYRVGANVIWGLTYRILRDLFAVAAE